jgi:drug/metabolite transporter (DMT)-like permease
LGEIPPLTFAGLRYTIAFLFLLPFTLAKSKIEEIRKIDRGDWKKLIALGILFYTFTQGLQFIGLSLLPAVTVSLILNFTPVVVALLGIITIQEIPSLHQWMGALLFVTGVLLYFLPADLSSSKLLGILIMIAGVIVNAGSAVLGRSINRSGNYHPLTVTIISMGVGSVILLASGLAFNGSPAIGLKNVLLLLWLAGVNTALAFTLWNLTLRSLSAMESSIINGTMLIQIAFLAWAFLGESITLKEGLGMLIAAAGAFLVQLRINAK